MYECILISGVNNTDFRFLVWRQFCRVLCTSINPRILRKSSNLAIKICKKNRYRTQIQYSDKYYNSKILVFHLIYFFLNLTFDLLVIQFKPFYRSWYILNQSTKPLTRPKICKPMLPDQAKHCVVLTSL